MLHLETDTYRVVVDDDLTYTSGSVDNKWTYQHEYDFQEPDYRPASQRSLRVYEHEVEQSSCILIAGGGATRAHLHSALINHNSCVVAVGPFLCSLSIPSLLLEWRTEADSFATCFCVYRSEKHECYITWGEMDIARVSDSGDIVWQMSGKDIFVQHERLAEGPTVLREGFALHEDYVEVADWNNDVYHVEISTGTSYIVGT